MAFRDGPFQDRRLPLGWLAAAATVIAALAALAILLVDRKDSVSGGYGAARRGFDSVVAPMGEVLETPVRWTGNGIQYVRGYFFAVAENRRLHTEIRDLERWRDAAVALKNINERYAALLKLKTEPEFPMVTGRAVVDTRGPFSNARLIDAGANEGVKVGEPVLGEHGVVGRVVGVTDEASRVLLLTDVQSRTPVLVDRTNARAILTGDGGGYPKLEYLRGRDPVRAGDLVLSSGDGGLYPRGLPVGVTVRDVKGGWRVRLFSDNGAIDFVRVLLFQDFSQAIPPTAFKSAMPPLNPAQKTEVEAVLQRAAAAPKPQAPTVGVATATGKLAPAPAAPAGSSPVMRAPPTPPSAKPVAAAPAPIRPAASPVALKPAQATASAPLPVTSKPGAVLAAAKTKPAKPKPAKATHSTPIRAEHRHADSAASGDAPASPPPSHPEGPPDARP